MKQQKFNLAALKRSIKLQSEANQQTIETLLASEPPIELSLYDIASKTGLDTDTIERELKRLTRKGKAVRTRKVWVYAHPNFLTKDAPTNTFDV